MADPDTTDGSNQGTESISDSPGDPSQAALDALMAVQGAITAAAAMANQPPQPAAAEPVTVTSYNQPAAAPAGPAPTAFAMPSFDRASPPPHIEGIELLSDVNLNVKIELGRTKMLVEDVLKLGEGSVVELDKLAGDPVDIYVNDRPVARGEVLVLNDNFCVRINEILDTTHAA